MQHLRYGFIELMSSCHKWIEDAGTLSCYGKMMKKEMEEDMLEDTYGSKEIILSSSEKMKEH